MDIQLLSWAQAEEIALPIRLEVFVKEQSVPLDLEQDAYDAMATHAILYIDGTAVGTARVFQKNQLHHQLNNQQINQQIKQPDHPPIDQRIDQRVDPNKDVLNDVHNDQQLDQQISTFYIGRLCVLQKYRGTGYGVHLMQKMLRFAKEQGAQQCCLHAQSVSQLFYKKLGFIAHDAVFMDAGIEHVEMCLML